MLEKGQIKERINKITEDLGDRLWAPRLVISEAVSMVGDLTTKRSGVKHSLKTSYAKEIEILCTAEKCPSIKADGTNDALCTAEKCPSIKTDGTDDTLETGKVVYPRPYMVRDSFMSLDGTWKVSMNNSAVKPRIFTDLIRVPFAPQSDASLFKGEVTDEFWYQKIFELPEEFLSDDERLILHFGAVDQIATVYVNGKEVGSHEGGYLPFSFDITDYLKTQDSSDECKESCISLCQSHEILVYVKDDLNIKYPYGKQVKNPEGMWYTPVSGIWQSVWLEAVSEEHINELIINADDKSVEIEIHGNASKYRLEIFEPEGKKIEEREIKEGFNYLNIVNPVLWSPENPALYSVKITSLVEEDTEVKDDIDIKGTRKQDVVSSYFAMRSISIEEIDGKERICLNHKPLFLHGILDQGYFPEGIYTPLDMNSYTKDILAVKHLGFNAIRKHIKVEPARFYYDCDRLGMLVLQDMVNNGDYSYVRDTVFPTFSKHYGGHLMKENNPEINQFFIKHSKESVRYFKRFPSIIYYTIFNEGWGQFEGTDLVEELRSIDDTRIYDAASGWFKIANSDVESIHVYYHKIKEEKSWNKPVIISECGGFTRLIPGHVISEEKIYGYGACASREELTDRIIKMYDEEVLPLISKGVCGTVYTQISDVEGEVNGLLTYDRSVIKVNSEKMRKMAERLYECKM